MDSFDYAAAEETRIFERSGRVLLSEHWMDAYSDPYVLIGPLQLLYYGLGSVFLDVAPYLRPLVFTGVGAAALTLATVQIVRLLRRDARSQTPPGLLLGIGAIVILGGYVWIAPVVKDAVEGLLALMWILSAREAREGRGTRAGILLGIATGLKLWGLLGLPILLLARRRRSIVIGGSAAVGTALVLHLPFVAFGTFRADEWDWFVYPQSPLRFVLGVDTAFTWEMRLAQSVVVVAVGAAFAFRLRRRPEALWAIPLACAAARLLTDPVPVSYYWLPVGIIVLVAVSSRWAAEPTWHWLIAAVFFYVTAAPLFLLEGIAQALWLTLASIGLLAGIALLGSHIREQASDGRIGG